MQSLRAFDPRLNTNDHMDTLAILFGLEIWNMPFAEENPPKLLMIMTPYCRLDETKMGAIGAHNELCNHKNFPSGFEKQSCHSGLISLT